jgi:hypothetical protein
MMTPKTQKCEIQLFIGSTLGILTNVTHCPQKWTSNNNPYYKNNTYIWRSQQNGYSLPNTIYPSQPTKQPHITQLIFPRLGHS